MLDTVSPPAPHFPPPPAPWGRTLVLIVLTAAASYHLTQAMEQGGAVRYAGRLRAESATLTAAHAGRIEQWLVAPGDEAAYRQPLLVLADDGLAERVARQRLEHAALLAEWKQAQARAEVDLAWRLKELESEILATQLRTADFLKEQFNQQMEGVAWREFVGPCGEGGDEPAASRGAFQPVFYEVGTPDEARVRALLRQEAALNAAETFAAQIKLCEQRLAELAQLKRDLPEHVRRAAGVDVAELRLKRCEAELQALQDQQARLSLDSPAGGIVGEFQKRAGEEVAAGDPIVVILDHDRRYITVDVPSREVPALAVGTRVALFFPGGHERAGRVKQVAPHTTAEDASGSDALVRVRIEPAGKLWPTAPIGSAVEVSPRG